MVKVENLTSSMDEIYVRGLMSSPALAELKSSV
jgi:hypothetical protein